MLCSLTPAFRLFSAITPISLSTTESYPLPVNPRLRPLPLPVQERIHALSVEASIDPSSLPPLDTPSTVSSDLEEWVSDLSTLPKPKSKSKSESHPESRATAPPAFLAFTGDIETACVALPSIRLRKLSSARDEEGDGEGGESWETEGRRKRRRRAYREFPLPQFWTPPEGVLARGWGRAYGYGSRV